MIKLLLFLIFAAKKDPGNILATHFLTCKPRVISKIKMDFPNFIRLLSLSLDTSVLASVNLFMFELTFLQMSLILQYQIKLWFNSFAYELFLNSPQEKTRLSILSTHPWYRPLHQVSKGYFGTLRRILCLNP